MSEAAISPQIVTEAAPTSLDSGLKKPAQIAMEGEQPSDFSDILSTQADSTEASLEQLAELSANQQSLPGLNGLLTTSVPAMAIATEVNGKQLPSALQANPLIPLQNNNLDVLLATKTPLEGQFTSSVATMLPTDENPLAIKPGSGLNSDLITSQLTANFTEKNLPNIKQLNAQVLSQLMQQAQPDKASPFDNTALTGSAPGIMVNQSLSMTSSEAMLPAISVRPDNPQFTAQVGERINWMVNNSMQRADIRLDPPELGNLDVRLHMAKDQQASIVFHVTNATAKDAIESAIPRLREMFEQQGLDLGNVDVSQQGPQQQQSEFSDQNELASNQQTHPYYSENEAASDAISAITKLPSSSNNNLLDIFA